MKTYPILNINNHNYWRNWTNTYLKEINSKARSLLDYVSYFNPDFLACDLKQTVMPGHWPLVRVARLPLHGYYQVKEKVFDETTQSFLEPGSLVVSYARAEGQRDSEFADIRKQEKYYTIQLTHCQRPFGWASFYIINGGNGEEISFTYVPKAQETYGLKYSFSFDTYAKRYYVTHNMLLKNLQDIKEQDKGMSLISNDGEGHWYIVNQHQNESPSALWTNITNNPLMHEFYYVSENNQPVVNNKWNCEQIIFDHTWKTSSKIAETNIAIYTINKKDSSKWPPNINLWFEAW